MNLPLNIDLIAEHVKNIVENIKCIGCDNNTDGVRVRFSCGHTSCSTCIQLAPECKLCWILEKTPAKPIHDETLSQQINNALVLLNSCEDTFNIDVYKRKRISELLKVEKEIFPECIQAPLKYYNKRKSSLSVDNYNKENRRSSFYLGEVISPLKDIRMKKANYVQEWLNQHDERENFREPFLDLNVNNLKHIERKARNSMKKRNDLMLNNVRDNSTNISKSNSKKRVYHKTTSLADYTTPPKQWKVNETKTDLSFHSISNKFKKKYDVTNTSQKIHSYDKYKSESSINNEPIFIDDIKNLPSIDKDKLALLAIELNENKQAENVTDAKLECSEIVNTLDIENDLSKTNSKSVSLKSTKVQQNADSNNTLNTRVPFYKMSSLCNECCYHTNYGSKLCTGQITALPNDVSITIDNETFTTIVKVSQNSTQFSSKESVLVQTDTCELRKNNKYIKDFKYIVAENLNKYTSNTLPVQDKNLDQLNTEQSQDLFTGVEDVGIIINKMEGKNLKDSNCISKDKITIINDSDSDIEVQDSSEIQVIAEIHRSCDQFDYDILTEVENESKRTKKCIRRGCTPNSTDSSEKENCDPNRAKRIKLEKKKYKKK